MRRPAFLPTVAPRRVVAPAAVVLAVMPVIGPAQAHGAVRLPGPLVALAAGPGTAYAVVSTRSRTAPFRLVRSGGSRVMRLRTFGSRGAEFADVAAAPRGPVAVFARPTSEGFSYESPGGATLGLGTGPPVVGLDGATTFTAFPDEDGDAAIARGGAITTLTRTGPALRHTPLDAVGGPLVLDLVQSASRSELRVVGPGAPSAPLTSAGGLQAIPATLTRDGARLYVAYVSKHRLTLATAPARPTGTWSRRRLSVRGALNGAPAVMRVGSRTLIATSRRAGGAPRST